jgi:hypothetical protein
VLATISLIAVGSIIWCCECYRKLHVARKEPIKVHHYDDIEFVELQSHFKARGLIIDFTKPIAHSGIYQLTEANFGDIVIKSNDIWLIKFYKHSDIMSDIIEPEFVEAAKEMGGRVKFG